MMLFAAVLGFAAMGPVPKVAKGLVIAFPQRAGFVVAAPQAAWDTVTLDTSEHGAKPSAKGKVFDLVQESSKQSGESEARYRVDTAFYSDASLSTKFVKTSGAEIQSPRLATDRPKGTFTGTKIASEEWHHLLKVCARLQLREGNILVCAYYYPPSVKRSSGAEIEAVRWDDLVYLEEVAKRALKAALKVDAKKLLALPS